MTPTSSFIPFFFFNDTATTEIYTLSLHDALPISTWPRPQSLDHRVVVQAPPALEDEHRPHGHVDRPTLGGERRAIAGGESLGHRLRSPGTHATHAIHRDACDVAGRRIRHPRKDDVGSEVGV